MRTKTKTVYYCEHCKKHGLCAGHMKKHEKHCTANPDRDCRVCDNMQTREWVEKWRGYFKLLRTEDARCNDMGMETFVMVWTDDKPRTLANLYDDTGGCPACTLAVMRQTGLGKWPANPEFGDFNYAKCRDEWWKERNAEKESEVGTVD